MIIVPKLKIVESDGITFKLRPRGFFTLRARRRSGRVTRELEFEVPDRVVGPFSNLITNAGLDKLSQFHRNEIYDSFQVGTGTTPPSVTDVQLANYHGGFGIFQNSPSTNSGAPEYYTSVFMTGSSAVGALGNVVLTEVGVASTITTGNLFSRELIRDQNGNPTSFPLSSDEQLEITYELRNYPPLDDVSFSSVMVGSTAHDCIVRARNVNDASTWRMPTFSSGTASDAPYRFSGNAARWQTWSTGLKGVTDSSTGTIVGTASSISNAAYVPGSFVQMSTATYGVNEANGSNRTQIVAGNAFMFQVEFNPPIVKNNTQTLILNQQVSWARR